MTQKEISKHVPVFQSKAWENRKYAIKMRVIRKENKKKVRKELREKVVV